MQRGKDDALNLLCLAEGTSVVGGRIRQSFSFGSNTFWLCDIGLALQHPQGMLWYECGMSLHVLELGPKLVVVLFRKVVYHLGGRALMEDVGHCDLASLLVTLLLGCG